MTPDTGASRGIGPAASERAVLGLTVVLQREGRERYLTADRRGHQTAWPATRGL